MSTFNEIEIKAKIDDAEMARNILQAKGCVFSEKLKQEDIIFLQNGATFSDLSPDMNVLRIRRENGKAIFNLKRNLSNELDCIEREVEVSDAVVLEDIIGLLGYGEIARVAKIRQKCKMNGYEICLDCVDGLGDFIEIEKMSDEEGDKVQEELWQFLLSLELPRPVRVFKGYDTLLDEKRKKTEAPL